MEELSLCTEALKNWVFYALSLLGLFVGFKILGLTPSFVLFSIFVLLGAWMSTVDFKHMILPDILTYTLLVLGLWLAPVHLELSLINSVLGTVIGGVFFFLLCWTFQKVRGYDGMGYGDVKLLAALGAWVGATGLPLILLVSSFVTLLFFALRRLVKGTKTSQPMPFGPFLILAGGVVLLYSVPMWQAIFKWRESFLQTIVG